MRWRKAPFIASLGTDFHRHDKYLQECQKLLGQKFPQESTRTCQNTPLSIIVSHSPIFYYIYLGLWFTGNTKEWNNLIIPDAAMALASISRWEGEKNTWEERRRAFSRPEKKSWMFEGWLLEGEISRNRQHMKTNSIAKQWHNKRKIFYVVPFYALSPLSLLRTVKNNIFSHREIPARKKQWYKLDIFCESAKVNKVEPKNTTMKMFTALWQKYQFTLYFCISWENQMHQLHPHSFTSKTLNKYTVFLPRDLFCTFTGDGKLTSLGGELLQKCITSNSLILGLRGCTHPSRLWIIITCKEKRNIVKNYIEIWKKQILGTLISN